MGYGDLEQSGYPTYPGRANLKHRLTAWCALTYCYAHQRLWELHCRLRFRMPMLFWKLLASVLRKFLHGDQASVEVRAISDPDRYTSFCSCDWRQDCWIDRPFSERYSGLLESLTSREPGLGGELIENVVAWKRLLTDLESLCAFTRSPEPFDRYPMGELQERLDWRLPKIYQVLAQVGLRLATDSLGVGTTSRVSLLRYLAHRWSASIGPHAIDCVDMLDAFRRCFIRVLWSPIHDDSPVETD